MSEDAFDAIVVGAGPAGTAAAYVLAKAGWQVVLIERGDYPGAKNVMGGILYRQAMEEVMPSFWKEAPVERYINEQRIWLLASESACSFGYKSDRLAKEPYNAFTILRAKFLSRRKFWPSFADLAMVDNPRDVLEGTLEFFFELFLFRERADPGFLHPVAENHQGVERFAQEPAQGEELHLHDVHAARTLRGQPGRGLALDHVHAHAARDGEWIGGECLERQPVRTGKAREDGTGMDHPYLHRMRFPEAGMNRSGRTQEIDLLVRQVGDQSQQGEQVGIAEEAAEDRHVLEPHQGRVQEILPPPCLFLQAGEKGALRKIGDQYQGGWDSELSRVE